MKFPVWALFFMVISSSLPAAKQETTGSLPSEDHLTTAGRAQWREEVIGPQIAQVNVMGGAFGKDGNGSPAVYAALMGQPGQLAVLDPGTGKLRRLLDMPGADGSYDAVYSTSGTLYLASHPKGNFYRYVPGSDAVEQIAAIAGVTFIWELVEGDEGKIYGACYPKSKLFEYDPATGQVRDLGSAKEGEDYARCIAWHPGRKKLYVGIGSHADLVEVDPATGERRSLLPEEHKSEHFVYSLGLTGDHVIARLDKTNRAIVINLETGKQEQVLPGFSSNQTSTPAPDGTVFYTADSRLMSWTPGQEPQVASPRTFNASARALGWSPSEDGGTSRIQVLLNNGNIFTLTRGKDDARLIRSECPAQPIHIQSIMNAPDGKIYSSGYVVGQVGVYDPADGSHRQFGGVKQAEGMTPYGSRIYFGTYPRAIISVFDTARPVERSNPKEVFRLEKENQDRPFGMLGVPEKNKVFVGTVPAYGVLGGVLAVYDPETSQVQVHENVVKDHGVVSFAYHDGILYGGTSIYGGLGIEPDEKDAKLFLWDVDSGSKILETVPVPGKRGLSGLQIGPDKRLWGWAEGTLFIYDLAERKVVHQKEHFTYTNLGRHFWRGGPMIHGKDGDFYGMVNGNLYRLDPETREVTVLARGQGIELLTQDNAGNLYFVVADKLHRLVPVK